MNYTHVLISRPQPEAGQLADAVAAAGLVPVVIPAYRFSGTAPGAEVDSFAQAAGRKLVIFTSKRAVEFGLRQLPDNLVQDAVLAAIGPATAAALETHGCPVSLVPQGGYTSEHLLSDPALADNPGAALLVAAPGGRTALAEGLEQMGWRVFLAHVYRREDVTPSPEEVGKLYAASAVISIWTSQNAMDVLARELPAPAWDKLCEGVGVVISERLGRALESRGVGRVVTAPGPGNEHLLAQVLELI